MEHPVYVVPGAMDALQALGAAATGAGVPPTTLTLVHLRASQINGCEMCVAMHTHELEEQGETQARLDAVAGWRDSNLFTDAERAALDLAEHETRLADREDPVPDPVWDAVTRHYDDEAAAVLVLAIASVNVWNRLNATTRQPVVCFWAA
jgi:AhpD family alkylhydroperoxidase